MPSNLNSERQVLADDEVKALPGAQGIIRRRVLEAARELVVEAGGLSVSLESLTFESVVSRADVPRTSAYRVWPTKDSFYVDLLCDLGGPNWQGSASFDAETIQAARNLIANRLEDLSTPKGRREVLEETVRLCVRQNFEAVTDSPQWRTSVALTATLLSSTSEVRDRVQAALNASETAFIVTMTEFYADVALILGLKLRPHIDSVERLATMGAAVIEGLALRVSLNPRVVELPILRDGKEWHVAAIGFLALIDACFEPLDDTEYEVSAALSRYLSRLAERETLGNTRA
jgi:AcrR family transcriptional regulator